MLLLSVGGYIAYQFFTPPFADSRDVFSLGRPLAATVTLSGNTFPISFDTGLTVIEALRRAGFRFREEDQVYPSADTLLSPGTNILWQPARTVRIFADGKEQMISVIAPTTAAIIAEAGMALAADDLVVPDREATVSDGTKIIITRVEIREETKEVKIPFVTKTEEDDELSWRKKIVQQKGENGV
ncbi:MAG: ubiquitin-like domain-containing protein, partial [Candidatus Moraniibacteriota bacterium]